MRRICFPASIRALGFARRATTSHSHSGQQQRGKDSEASPADVLSAPSQCAFYERMQQVVHRLRSRLYSVYRPQEFAPRDFEQLLAACERHGDHQFVSTLISTFTAMLRLPLPPSPTPLTLEAWTNADEKLIKCIRRAAKLLPPAEALNMIRKNVLGLREDSTNSQMCKSMLSTLRGRTDVDEAQEVPVGNIRHFGSSSSKPDSEHLDLGIVAAVAGCLVRQGDKDMAMDLAEAAVSYRLRETRVVVRDVEVVAAECAEAAAMIGNSELVARFSFVMFRSCGALATPAKPTSSSFADWWKSRICAPSTTSHSSAEVFEASLAQVLASAVRASFSTTDAGKGIADAIAICNKLKAGASWDAHSAMVRTILSHISEQHSGIEGDKTTMLQTSGINLLASLAERFPRDFNSKQQAAMAECVAFVMALFASTSFVSSGVSGQVLSVVRALSPIRLIELFSRLPAKSEYRRQALPVLLAGCAGTGDWQRARQEVIDTFQSCEKNYPALLELLAVKAGTGSEGDNSVFFQSVLALLIHCEMFSPDLAAIRSRQGSKLGLPDDVLLILAHSLAVSHSRLPPGVVVETMLHFVEGREPVSARCATEIILASLVHRQPAAATLQVGHALCQSLLRSSCELPPELEMDWKLVSPLIGVNFAADVGFTLANCSEAFGAVLILDRTAVSGTLPQFLATLSSMTAEALRRSSIPPSTAVLVAFSWGAMQEAAELFGQAFRDEWLARRNSCVFSPLLCPASCFKMSDISDLGNGFVNHALLHSGRSGSQCDMPVQARARTFLWVETEEAGDVNSPVGCFQTLSKRKLSVSKTLHDVRSLLGMNKSPSLPSVVARGSQPIDSSPQKLGGLVSNTRSMPSSASLLGKA